MKVILIKLAAGKWCIVKEDGKLAPKHEFHDGIPMREIKQWCKDKKLEIHAVILPDWSKQVVT